MKRIVSIVLFAAMLFTLAVPAAFAAGGVSVSVSGAQANPNDVVTLYFSLNGLTEGYISGKLTVTCDTGLTLLSLEGVAFNGFAFGNKVNHSSARPETGTSIAKATFQVNSTAESGEYKVYASIADMVEVDYTPISVASGVGVVTVHSHTWGSYLSDRDGHWQKCSCGETSPKAPHVPGAAPTVDSAQLCTICGYELAPKLPAPHNHVWGAWLPVNSVQHKRICADDPSHVDYANHNFIDNVCTDCGYELDIEIPEEPDDELSEQELMLLIMLLRNRTSTINATAGEGGWISPAGATKVKFSQSQTYTIQPMIGYEIESVVVDGRNMGAIREYTFKRVVTGHTISVTFKKIVWENPFSDVSEKDWFYNDVACANQLGLMIGTSDTTFSPEGTATRAQVITTLWRMENEPMVDEENIFTDVAEGMYYTNAIVWATANNIVEGHGDGTFGPDDPITREQIVAILHRYAEYKDLGVEAEQDLAEDIICSEWAEENIRWALANNIFHSMGVEIKDMTVSANRAEIAAYLTRMYVYVLAK